MTRKFPQGYIDPVALVGAALLCSVATRYIIPRQSRLCAEILGWVMLAATSQVTKARRVRSFPGIPIEASSNAHASSSDSSALWLTALGVAELSLVRTEDDLATCLVGCSLPSVVAR